MIGKYHKSTVLDWLVYTKMEKTKWQSEFIIIVTHTCLIFVVMMKNVLMMEPFVLFPLPLPNRNCYRTEEVKFYTAYQDVFVTMNMF